VVKTRLFSIATLLSALIAADYASASVSVSASASVVGISKLANVEVGVDVGADIRADLGAKNSRRLAGTDAASHFDSQNPFAAYMSALMAQQNRNAADSARYYLEAVSGSGSNLAVAERAFFQLLYAGRIDDAYTVSRTPGFDPDNGRDIAALIEMMVPFTKGDWASVHAAASAAPPSGIMAFLVPIIRAWAFAGAGDLPAAEASLDILSESGDFDKLVAEQRAYIADFMGDQQVATARYTALVGDEKPSTLQPYVQYAAYLVRRESRSAAKRFLKTSLRRFPANQFLMRERRRILAGRGPTVNAAHPRGSMTGILYRLSSEFVRSNSRQAAVFYLRVADYVLPDHDDTKVMLGAQFEAMDDQGSAAQIYAEIGEDSALYRIARQRRLAALRALNDRAALDTALAEALRDDADNPTLLLMQADLAREDAAYDDAIRHYTDLITRSDTPSPSDWYLYFARGVSYDLMQKWPEAEADLLQALELKADEPATLNYLGYSWIDRDQNHDQATVMIQKALAADPSDGFVNDSLGWVYYLQGDFARAIDYLELAVSLEPGDAVISDHLGDAYWQSGRRVEARYQWRQALQNNPETDVRERLGQKLRQGLGEKG